ncbi:hypothetical protein [Siphonobacter sp. SORGH_AS_1065]|uniref:hypothetical protein n=1 Tax=Siphonobacter sp. SORGH_AS_1065 TaxID=3041795 RepID=UPI0027858DDC|nr:hypothetical protein [Siphonobacter sp. SORGH_AS_1065]MDQ1089775.1 hypothetical protein [Siphonobacter sp. SORGH_AS_1065]
MLLTLRDETFSGQLLHSLSLDVVSQTLTVKELIASRVEAEVQQYNQKLPTHPLIVPNEAEQGFHGLKTRRFINTEKQIDIALNAFEKNGFFILIDEEQVQTLDQVVEISPLTKISFIKLTPLMGG